MKKQKPRKQVDRRHGPRRKCLLVEGWREAYKWFSVQAAAALAAAQGLYEFVPTAKSFVPESVFHWVMAGLTGLVILARLKNQGVAK